MYATAGNRNSSSRIRWRRDDHRPRKRLTVERTAVGVVTPTAASSDCGSATLCLSEAALRRALAGQRTLLARIDFGGGFRPVRTELTGAGASSLDHRGERRHRRVRLDERRQQRQLRRHDLTLLTEQQLVLVGVETLHDLGRELLVGLVAGIRHGPRLAAERS